MYLKKLELQGFKSFPDNIKLEFNKGITSVVGPNGSGKSNVSDAIRWVIGEQSAKNLRGNKMEDIIFAGTANRKQVGFAEVSITIDNSDKLFKLDFPEIKVTRRVLRSGEGTFFINDVPCRLKDIHELFMDTGIGKEGYSIIGQGRIEEILKSKSDERRLLFEEATGIVKYKSKKKEAETKLQRERENLVRINDIIHELELQLAPLGRQAEKAKTYLNLYEEQKSLKINVFVEECNRYEEKTNKIIKLIEDYKEEVSDKEKDYSLKETTIENFKQEVEELAETIEELKEQSISDNNDLMKKESAIEITKEKIKNINNSLIRIENEISERKKEIDKKEKDLDDYNLKLKLVDKSIEEKNQELKEKKESFEKLNLSVQDKESEFETINNLILDNMRNITNIKNNIETEEGNYNLLEEEKEHVIYSKNNLISGENEKKITIKLAEKKIEDSSKNVDESKEKIKAIEEKQRTLKEKNYNLYQELDDLNRRFQENHAKHKALTDLEKSHEGYFESVKYILNGKKEKPKDFEEIMGVVSEVILTEKKYEVAIETALGGAIQNIITKTEIGAKKAIELLKNNKKGRATFLPINKVKQNFFNDHHILEEKGVVGLASHIVNYEEVYQPIVNHLLGKIIIIDTLENGLNFSNKYKYSYRVVTLDGDVLSTGGSISGGSQFKKKSKIFGRSREIKEYEKTVNTLKIEIDKLTAIQENVNLQLKQYKDELAIGREFLLQETENLQENIRIKENGQIEYKYILEQLEEKRNKDKVLTESIILKNIEIKKLYTKQEELEKTSKELEIKLINYKEEVEANKDEHELHVKELMEYNVKISKMEEHKKSIEDNIVRLSQDIEKLNSVISIQEKDLLINGEDIEENRLLIKSFEEEIQVFKDKINNTKERINKLVIIKNEKINNVNLIEKSNKELFSTISILKTSIAKEENRLEQQEILTRNLYDDMWNEFEMTLQKALEYPKVDLTYEESKKKLGKINNEIKLLGHVNVNAIEDFEEVNGRYEFLCTQRNDIIDGEAQLKIIIDDLTKLMSDQFSQQFTLIRENFQKVFKEMFEGGFADVVLTDEGDILGSGIDIIAQPPGKKLSNITLMSGGEKSLTAIALLFGILKLKPSPFCILDEIEAALDDANVYRYGRYLKKFSENTQFILITHRKGTMEIADVLYGVTMEEQGVSKLVSVQLTDY